VFRNQNEYERKIQEARRTNGKASPEEFTRNSNITREAGQQLIVPSLD
jgi:hypothetical protein